MIECASKSLLQSDGQIGKHGGLSEPRIRVRRVSGKFGDKWGVLVKKSVESRVVSNEE